MHPLVVEQPANWYVSGTGEGRHYMNATNVVTELHLPNDVWLVGKGPSLSKYDWSQVTGPVVCINETVFVVPVATMAVAIDYNVLDKYQEANIPQLVLRKATHRRYVFQHMFLWTYQDHAPGPKTGTATIATQILYTCGARRIHYVGFDSVDGETAYDNNIKAIKGEGTNMDGFRSINTCLLNVIQGLGIEAVWEHRGI